MRNDFAVRKGSSSAFRGFLIIFFLSTLVRLLLSVFPKTAVTYNDELFYLELSQNLFLRGSLTVYNSPIHFTKLLYPVLLSPFYAVTDGVLRTQMISAFNALLISSALIPAYLLARRILAKTWQIILSLLFLAISPNLLFSLTFMAENLYYPLLLWGFLAAYCWFSSEYRRPLHALLLGLLAFLIYCVKEVGAAWIFAAGVALLAGFRDTPRRGKKTLLSFIFYLLGIIVPYIILHLTILRGMGYSYATQVALSNLSDASHILFFLYAAGITLLFFLFSVLFFPAAVPVVFRKKLSLAKRSLLLLTGTYILAVSAGIAFGISLYLDYPHTDLQLHLRYYLGAAFPLLLLSFSVLDDSEPVTLKSPFVVSSVIYACLLLLFLTVPAFGSLVAFPALHFTHLIPRDSVLWRWIFTGVSVLLLLPPLLLWNRKRMQAFACFLLPLLLVLECFSCAVFTVNAREEEKVETSAFLNETQQLDQLLDTLDGNTLLLAESPFDSRLKLVNTTLNDDYAFATFQAIQDMADAREDPEQCWLDLSRQPLPDPLSSFSGSESYNLSGVNQIVTIGDFPLLDSNMNVEIAPEDMTSLHVYRAKDPSRIALYNPLSYTLGESILFYGLDPSFRKYKPEGFSVTEEGYTWSNGVEATLTLCPRITEPCDLVGTWTWRMVIGDQYCQIFANDTLLCDVDIVSEEKDLFFYVPARTYAETGTLTLRFLFPNAREPGNGDPRLLAFAFESLILEEK